MTDYLSDNTNDLKIANGNFVQGDSTIQNQNFLLITAPGAWKQNPQVGVGLMNFLKDDDITGLMRSIRQQFAKDGMTVQKLALTNGKIQVVAPYGE